MKFDLKENILYLEQTQTRIKIKRIPVAISV